VVTRNLNKIKNTTITFGFYWLSLVVLSLPKPISMFFLEFLAKKPTVLVSNVFAFT
jgi:hypothetical protein